MMEPDLNTPVHQALPTFIAQAGGLLGEMETELLKIELDSANTGAVHALFRVVHTLKGAAGLFGLHHVVAGAHVLESVLDDIRARRLLVTPTLATLLRTMHGHLSALVSMADRQSASPA
jgi:two-component system chemotaxis sensor kinase CheA